MSQKNTAIYSYESSSVNSLIFKSPIAYLIVLVYGAICLYLIASFHIAFLLLIVVSGIILYKVSNRNKAITLEKNFLIVGDVVIWYSSIDQIKIIQNKKAVIVRKNNIIKITIDYENFPTNARKSWKVEKNKKEKFNKVLNKILSRVKTISPQTTIKHL